jgi:hypothetical protein
MSVNFLYQGQFMEISPSPPQKNCSAATGCESKRARYDGRTLVSRPRCAPLISSTRGPLLSLRYHYNT